MTAAQAPETPIITTGGDGDNKFTKIALIALGIVLLVIISEVGYFIFAKRGDSLFKPKETAVQEEQERLIINITSTPTPTPLPKEEVKSITVDSDKARKFADLLDSIKANNELDLLKEASINFTATGVVVSAAFSKMERDAIEYVYRLQIKNPEENTANYWFTDKEILDAQISLITGTETKQIPITDIKPDDNIVVKEIINLLDSSPHSKVILEVRR